MWGEPPKCRQCGRIIKFILTKNGRWMPVEPFSVMAIPYEKGTTLVREDGTTFRGMITKDKQGTRAWTPHFAVCAGPRPTANKKAPAMDPALKKAREEAERKKAEAEKKAAEKAEFERREREWWEAQYSIFRQER